MRFARHRPLVASIALAAAALPALAQDYTVSNVTNQYLTPPGGGPNLIAGTKSRDDNTFVVTPSFPIFYFGKFYSSMQVCTNGFVQFGGGTSVAKTQGSKFPLTGTDDGICAVAWDDLDGLATGSTLTYWTEGSAPNRKFVVAWVAWTQAPTTGSIAFQVQFHETTGRIVMAYAPGWTGQTRQKSVGIDAPLPDTRFVTPDGSNFFVIPNVTQPANDYRFDPKITTFSGRLLFDRVVVSSAGIGTSVEKDVPAAGARIEIRNAAGTVVGQGYADADGNFAALGPALTGTESGSLVVTSETPACTVKPSAGGSPYSMTIATNVPFSSDREFGSIAITDATDPGAAFREPLNVARSIFGVYDWCVARAGDPIAPLDVLWNPSSSAATAYSASGGSPLLTVSAAAANPDGWDTPVIRKAYARHVLAEVARGPSTPANTAFDSVTDDENAFAEGFGYHLAAVVGGGTTFIDGTSASAATTIDLEAPQLLSPKGAAVAGWNAAGLFDLTDAANEAWDTFDAAGDASGQLYRTVASVTGAVTSTTVYVAWGQLGFPGADLARDFIHHGLIGDDADEPNDSVAEPRIVPAFGFIRLARVLNNYNEDWHQFTLNVPTNALTVDVIYDRLAISADVTLEIRDAADNVVATGSNQGVAGPNRAVTGPLAAGTYRSRVVHESGARVDSYTLQAFSELTLSAGALAPWTVGRPYNSPVDVRGGIPPYSLTVEHPFVKPPGLVLDGPNSRVTGTPTEAGVFDFSLTARDQASPNNLASVPQSFTVNPELEFGFGDFTAFAMGKPIDRAGATTGGTAPFVFRTTEGSLPDGLAFPPGEFRFVGTPGAAGSFPCRIEGTDVAGSSAERPTTGVVCVPFGTASLAGGAASCGFWFDAVAGTSVAVKVGTVKKQPKRALEIVVLGADGTTVVPAAAKPGNGKASVAGFVAPSSGRFYVIVSSGVGDATELTGSAKWKAPAKGAGDSGERTFVPGQSFSVDVGALAGAAMSFSAKPDKSGLLLKVQYLLDPAGAVVPVADGDVTEKAGAVSFAKTLGASGTWRVVLGARPGPQGRFTWSFKLKQPKGVTYSAD